MTPPSGDAPASPSADEASSDDVDGSASADAPPEAEGSAPPPVASWSGAAPAPPSVERQRKQARVLMASVLVVATCGLVYELISATMASYLLGDSVTQWSLVIGVYLSAMGLGSWLSKYVETALPERFVHVQLVIAVVGGFSATALFFGFGYLATVRPLLFLILVVVGTMVGLEIPLLMRLMQPGVQLKDLVARVLAFDYIGALAASILFPLLLLPYLGLVRTALLFGLLNAAVALWSTRIFASEMRRPGWVTGQAVVVLAVLAGAFFQGRQIEDFGESQLYEFPVVFSKKTPYQRLTITRWQSDVRLFINGNLQFSSTDEHRYHEALVHPAMAGALPHAGEDGLRVLVLGGGDGLALRELQKYEAVRRVDLVDLDPAMTDLFTSHPLLTALNGDAFADADVHVHNDDAMEWLSQHRLAGGEPFDVAIIDLPDPNNFSLGKLYTRSFYRLVRSQLTPQAVAVVQSTSPYFAPRSYWCIVETLRSAGLNPQPYHTYVPSFGDWGFVLVSPRPHDVPTAVPADVPLRFLTDAGLASMFEFPADQAPRDVEVNRLNDQLLVHYYESDIIDPFGRGNRRPGGSELGL
ncbi:MAG: polyamine aminopropyltransferase [Myxococcota bacterium]